MSDRVKPIIGGGNKFCKITPANHKAATVDALGRYFESAPKREAKQRAIAAARKRKAARKTIAKEHKPW